MQITGFGAVLRRSIKRRLLVYLLVGDRYVEAVAKRAQRLAAHFFLLVGDVLAFAGLAHAVAFDGFGQNYGRLALMVDRRVIGGIDLMRVMAAAVEPPDVLVGHVSDHGLELGVLAEKMLAGIRAAFRLEVLVLAVDRLLH